LGLTDRQTDTDRRPHRHWQTGKQKERQADRQTDKQTDSLRRQADRQTRGRQTERLRVKRDR
jgi:hypothetical protein